MIADRGAEGRVNSAHLTPDEAAALTVAPRGNTRSSGYERDPHDWYVEDRESVAAMFRHIHNGERTVWHDPCCGGGNILRVAADLGIAMTGADLIDRADGKYPVRDFLEDAAAYAGILTNPPFRLAVPILRHALKLVENVR